MVLQGVVQSKAVMSGLASWPSHGTTTTSAGAMSTPFLRTGPASAHAWTHAGDDPATSKLLSIAHQGFHGASQQRRSCQRLVCNAAASGNGSNGPKMVVAITGATGFIGSKLVDRLVADGHEVRILTRSESKAREKFPEGKYPGVKVGDESKWAELIKGSTGVVNLAGPPISTRWTPEVKADIKNCRVAVTGKVVKAINSAPKEERPAVLVSSTAVGFYGTSETSAFDETSPSGNDYLAEVCKAWEASARRVRPGTRLVLLRTGIVLDGEEGGSLGSVTLVKAVKQCRQSPTFDTLAACLKVCRVWEEKAKELENGTRLVLIRTGIVLDKDGGALAKMVPIFSIFAGGPLGSGKQWFSWVHRDDLVNMIIESLRNPAYEGVINGTAPNPVRMAEMCDRLGAILGRPSWLPVPEFALKAILGEGATVVLEGQRVLPKRAQELGFSFKYRYISDALEAILTT